MIVDAVKATVYRMRKRYQHLLRSKIEETVSSPEEVNEEIKYLFSVCQS